jgi:DNA-binding beta-propeller fold protein YncE
VGPGEEGAGAQLELEVQQMRANAEAQAFALQGAELLRAKQELLQAKAQVAELRAEIRIKDAALEAKDKAHKAEVAVLELKLQYSAAPPAPAVCGSAAVSAEDPKVLALSQALEALDIGASSSCLTFAKALEQQGVVSMERLKKMREADARKVLEAAGMKNFQVLSVIYAIALPAPAAAAAAPPPPAPAPAPAPAAAAAAGTLGRVRVGAVAAAGAGFARAIGSNCKGHGQFPYGGVRFDGEGNLVVADGDNHRIQVFRYSNGAHLRSFGSRGAGAGQFDVPWGIAFDGAGHIIVSEHGGSRVFRVQVLRYSDGAHVRTIGSRGSGNGQLNYAKGIAVDGEGNVAVFDSGNARVQVFRLSDGAYVRTSGSRGSGNGQFAAGCGGVAVDSEGNLVVVADWGNHRVQVLRYRDGAHVRTFGSKGAGAGQFQYPTGVAFDAAGHIVVVEYGNHRVQVLRYSDGAHVRTIGRYGSGSEQFNSPLGGIAIDSDGRVVVADSWNHRVQVLQ